MRRQVWLILGGLAAGVALVSLLAFDAGYAAALNKSLIINNLI